MKLSAALSTLLLCAAVAAVAQDVKTVTPKADDLKAIVVIKHRQDQAAIEARVAQERAAVMQQVVATYNEPLSEAVKKAAKEKGVDLEEYTFDLDRFEFVERSAEEKQKIKDAKKPKAEDKK